MRFTAENFTGPPNGGGRSRWSRLQFRLQNEPWREEAGHRQLFERTNNNY